MMRRKLGPWLSLGLLVLAGLGWLCLGRFSYQPYGTLLAPPQPAYDFTLNDPQNKPFKLSALRGKAVLIFFGYTHCPDVCPLTMLELSKIYKALTPPERKRVQVLMITTDPKRDTAAVVSRYAAAFEPSFTGLTGDAEAIAQTARNYYVGYFAEKTESDGEYSVAHNADVFLVSPRGTLRLIYTKGKTAQTAKVVQDLRWVLAGR